MKDQDGREKQISQSAIDNVNVEGNLTIESIKQIINLSDDEKLRYIEFLNVEYQGKLAEEKTLYRSSIRSFLRYLHKELRKLHRDIEGALSSEIDELHKLERKEEIKKQLRKRYRKEKEKLIRESSDDKPSYADLLTPEESAELGWADSIEMLMSGHPNSALLDTVAHLTGVKNPVDQKREDIDELREDLEELEEIKDSVSQFLRIDPINIDIDRVVSTHNLNNPKNIEDLKKRFIDERLELNEKHSLNQKNLQKERDLKIYKFQLVRYLNKDGFPLSQESINLLSNFLEESVLTTDDIEEAGSQAARIFCQKNLDFYEYAYSQKLGINGFPLNKESLDELDNLKERLGFTSLSFLKVDIDALERKHIQPYYKDKACLYLKLYQQKLEENSLALDSNLRLELKNLESSWGLRQFSFEDFDLDAEKTSLVKSAYGKATEKYKNMYTEKLESQGLQLNLETLSFLRELQESLGLTDYHIKLLNYDHVFSPDKELEDLQKNLTVQFYKNKLLEFSLKFSQSTSSKGSYISLGIKEEDLNTVQGIASKGWSIDHLIMQDAAIDYWQLINFLRRKNWQQANEFTLVSLFKLAQQPENTKLSKKALEKISKKDIYTLDKLWREYSRDRFGFSVQQRILETVDRSKNKLFEQIGWKRKRSFNLLSSPFKSTSELTFSLDAPLGHLPAWNTRDKQIFDNSLPHFQTWEFDAADSKFKRPF